jgi:hypothetical protein
VRLHPINEETTITPTMITGSGTRPTSNPATTAATTPAFNANRIVAVDDGAKRAARGVEVGWDIAFTLI